MSEKKVKIIVDKNFFVLINEKNKLNGIEFNSFFLNEDIKSNYVKNFVELSAMLRHFLNRNDVKHIMTMFYFNKEQKTKTLHKVELQSIKEKSTNERFLMFNFTKKFILDFDDDSYIEEALDAYARDFTRFDVKITPQTAQLWLEYLNKFAVDAHMEIE